MSVPIITFFNNKGGVGKTSLAYHLAWMFQDKGKRVLVADIDPQANLSAAFLDEGQLETLWAPNHQSIYGSMQPLIRGVGDYATPHLESIADGISLLVGDMMLSRFEDMLSEVWPKCSDGDERSFRVVSAFWRSIREAAEICSADVVLVDLGPNLGAINRSALIASDHVVVPLAPDLFSLQGLRNLAPALSDWRKGWGERLKKNPDPTLNLPPGKMALVGYVVMQHIERLSRPTRAYARWVERIPGEYREVSKLPSEPSITAKTDPHCLGFVRHYRSLAPMAQEAGKPIFQLKPADGAIGSHMNAVTGAYRNFAELAENIALKTNIPLAPLI